MKDSLSKIPFDAAAYRIAAGSVVGGAAIIGGMTIAANHERQSPMNETTQPAPSMHVETKCTGTRKVVASPNSLDTGVMISLTVNTHQIPAEGTIIHFENPRTGESIVAGYYTPDETIPPVLQFSGVIVDKQPSNKMKPDQDKNRFHLRPDDEIIVTMQKSLPNGMYIKKEDLAPHTDSEAAAELTHIDIPKQGPIIAEATIEKLCP